MMLDLLLFHSFLLQIATGSCTASSIAGCFSSIYATWFSFAGAAALAVLAILSIMYAIFHFVGRSDIKAWTRVKIYDVILSLLLIIAFAIAASIIYNLPVGNLTSLQIVPTECQSSVYNIYSLSICDMSLFNTYAARLDSEQYYLLLVTGTIQPTFRLEFTQPITGTGAAGWRVSAGADLSLLNSEITFKYLGTGVDLIYGFVLANDLQLIILSSSALLFAIFMSLGLIARIFGVTRTFGGAMIAFAIGLGILYPALIIVNYGFINYGIDNVFPTAIARAATLLGITVVTGVSKVASVGAIAWAGSWFNTTATNNIASFATLLPEPIFVYVGLVWIGLTFIPLIILIIVDVFIIDFSQAIGERMDLLSMLVRIL
jgi:hypothetical protein